VGKVKRLSMRLAREDDAPMYAFRLRARVQMRFDE